MSIKNVTCNKIIILNCKCYKVVFSLTISIVTKGSNAEIYSIKASQDKENDWVLIVTLSLNDFVKRQKSFHGISALADFVDNYISSVSVSKCTDSIFDLIHYCETRKEGYNIFYSFVLCLVEYVVFTWKPLFHSNLLLSSVISRSSLGEPKVRIVFMRHFFCQLIQSHKYD